MKRLFIKFQKEVGAIAEPTYYKDFQEAVQIITILFSKWMMRREIVEHRVNKFMVRKWLLKNDAPQGQPLF